MIMIAIVLTTGNHYYNIAAQIHLDCTDADGNVGDLFRDRYKAYSLQS